MKQILNNALKIGGYAIGIFIFIILVGSIVPEVGLALQGFGLDLVPEESMVLATTTIVGTVTREAVETAEPGHLQRQISKNITKIKPDEYPLDTMIRNLRSAESVINTKVEYETVTYRGRQSNLDVAFTQAGDATDEQAVLQVSNPLIWELDSNGLIHDVLGLNNKPLRFRVIAKSATTITVQALNGTQVGEPARMVSIPINTQIYRGGTGKSELDSQTTIVTQVPAQAFNYCQIQMSLIEQSQVQAKHRAYSKYAWRERIAQAFYDFRNGCEATGFFGVKSKNLDPIDNEYNYSADGLIEIIAAETEFGTGAGEVDPDVDDVLDFQEVLFADNAGSDERCLFVGKSVATGLAKMTYTKELEAKETEIYHGVKVQRLYSPFGSLLVKHHKLLDQMGYANRAVAVDLQHVVKNDLEPLTVTNLELDKSGTRRVQDSRRMHENTCLTIRYPGTHGIWKPSVS
jgi:hypothetical protein